MKRLIVLLVFILVPLAAFADLQLGPTALYNFTVSDPNKVDLSGISLSDFTFGLDSRLNVSIVQGSAYLLVTPGSINEEAKTKVDIYTPTKVDVFLDIGLCLDILMFRLSAGIGPNFAININYPVSNDEPDVFGVGGNIKLAADLMLGGISVGLVYFMDTNFTKEGATEALQKWDGRIGLSVLFKLL
jgi:hypothetical protein